MYLMEKQGILPIVIEREGYEGVRRIGQTLAEDICLVTGQKPSVLDETALESPEKRKKLIFCATWGKSALLEQLHQKGIWKEQQIAGKREVFSIQLLENPFPGVEQALVIAGSDKRGTIYGMFHLSEYLGVTPLVYWGDAAPAKNPQAEIREDICCVSREPSVKYRGFFINDEWPCFGNWVNEHFGGFCADAYRYVFEFLLRMKGNYLWPAMWTSSFPLDGPGSANEELADMYGVIIGYSHHEPCLRASEEWDKVKGKDTPYGCEWNFATNEKGLLQYWTDALKRSGKYENIITIGMRGERDSSMLGEDATVEENIALLKKIITKQRELIKQYVNEDLKAVPQMLALYKEVEAYFYGDEKTPGLKDWKELEDVICMLCEDNFGHMRTLPTEEMRKHKGGYGMYYHLDYHGGPISYEWVDSTPLSKIWDQMCTAYEYGVRELWIVNVGDLKLHEVPLWYFMELAWDFEKWGSSNPESYIEFRKKWAEECFPKAGKEVQQMAGQVLREYMELAHLRRPESLNEEVYHPCHELEADRMLERAQELEQLSGKVWGSLPEEERAGYYSMVHFSTLAYCNLLQMHLYAGKNRHYAEQGRPVANWYGQLSGDCMERDRRLAAEFASFAGGKWSGMELAPHIGFRKWNEDGCRYPVLCHVEPVKKPRLSVSRADEERVCVKNYGTPEVITVEDFIWEGTESVLLEAANDGIGRLEYQVVFEEEAPDWLKVEPMRGRIEQLQRITLTCDRSKISSERQKTRFLIKALDTEVAVEVSAAGRSRESLPERTWLPKKHLLSIPAEGYFENRKTDRGAFRIMKENGCYESAVRVFPATAEFSEQEEAPEVGYRFLIPERGTYRVELIVSPNNSSVAGKAMRVRAFSSGEEKEVLLLPDTFQAGDHRDGDWCRGVLRQRRNVCTEFFWEAGVQQLFLKAVEPGFALQRLYIYPSEEGRRESYLGPELSAHTPESNS